MATEAPLYDLILLLDNTIEQERRDTILANVEDAVDRAGEIVGRHDWGVRPTVYEVRKQSEADYHLLQFHGPASLLEQLDHNLKITDGILPSDHQARPGTPPRRTSGRPRSPPSPRRAAPQATTTLTSRPDAAPRAAANRAASARLRGLVKGESLSCTCGGGAEAADPTPRLGSKSSSA